MIQKRANPARKREGQPHPEERSKSRPVVEVQTWRARQQKDGGNRWWLGSLGLSNCGGMCCGYFYNLAILVETHRSPRLG